MRNEEVSSGAKRPRGFQGAHKDHSLYLVHEVSDIMLLSIDSPTGRKSENADVRNIYQFVCTTSKYFNNMLSSIPRSFTFSLLFEAVFPTSLFSQPPQFSGPNILNLFIKKISPVPFQ